jgi:hypothetical protein
MDKARLNEMSRRPNEERIALKQGFAAYRLQHTLLRHASASSQKPECERRCSCVATQELGAAVSSGLYQAP